MTLRQVNGNDFLPAAFQKVNANFNDLDDRLISLETDPQVRRFDYNEAGSSAFTLAIYGGRYEDASGDSYFSPDQTVTLVEGTNYVEMEYASKQMSANTVDFTPGTMRLYRVDVDAAGTFTTLIDMRAPDKAQVSVGFSHFTDAGDGPFDYRYRGGQIRLDNQIVTLPAGVLTLPDGQTNYVEAKRVGGSWSVQANTVKFSPGAMPLAIVLTSAVSIAAVQDVRGAVIAGAGGAGGFYDAASWMMA